MNPPPRSGSRKPSGIIEPELLLSGYASGYFPMAESRQGPIRWLSPDPRAIIPIESFKMSRSLRQTIRKGVYEIRINTRFEEVMRACAERDETWISEEIVQSYVRLHTLGFAHSVEAWSRQQHRGTLAGGLYGVALGAAFFGESMFSRSADASKVALVHLVERLREREFELLDTQFITPHLSQFGTIEIPRAHYLRKLAHAIRTDRRFAG